MPAAGVAPGEVPQVPATGLDAAGDFAPPVTAGDGPFEVPPLPGAVPELPPPELPQSVPATVNYYPNEPQVEAPPPAAGPDQDPFRFSQWTEQDGGIVFENGPGAAPERGGPQPSELPEQAADEPDEAPLGGVLGDVFGLLQSIQEGIQALAGGGSQGRGANGLNLPTGPQGLPWSGIPPASLPEASESYAAASPGIFDATTTAGAGGLAATVPAAGQTCRLST